MDPRTPSQMLAMPDEEWLYRRNADNSARFILGTPGEQPLVCFGINPSTAAPNALDRTVALVARVAAENGHDSFVMLNVYPQRATRPRDMDRVLRPGLQQENERHIADVVGGRELTIWAAWGSNIDSRTYLSSCLAGILALPELSQSRWVSRGAVTKRSHPRHPLYVKNGTPLERFDMQQYLRNLSQATAP